MNNVLTVIKMSLIRQLYEAVSPIAPTLPYHNMPHMVDVTRACMRYARAEGLGDYERLVLKAAGMTHDGVYVVGRKDNEERTVELARDILPGLEYPVDLPMDEFLRDVSSAIMATKLPTSPRNKVEMVLCDADIDNTGRPDCLEKGELLRQELGLEKDQWYRGMLDFLSGVQYYTDSARAMREQGLQENIERVRGLI